jgi:biotin carboxylase
VPELMVIGVGRMGLPYVEAARRLGVEVRVVEAASRAGALLGRVDALHTCSGERDEHWAQAALTAATSGRPDGIVAFNEPQVLAAALLQDRLDLPGPSLHAAVLSRNKALQRATFAAHSVRQPGYRLADTLSAETQWALEHLPVVIKPLSGAGSDGVELVGSACAYREAIARRASERPLLVEAAIDGPEYSWEAVVVGGQVWCSNLTAKETTGAPYFVEVAHRAGVQLPPAAMRAVDELTARVLSGLEMDTGIVHLEFRMASAGPTLMEVAVRTPGDFLMDLLGLTYGVDWFELVVRAALSLPLPAAPATPVRYAASYLPIAKPGVVREIRGLDQVNAHPCTVHSALLVEQGDSVAPLQSSAQRVGHVVMAADTPAELDDALDYVRATLSIDTDRQERTIAPATVAVG